MAAAFSLPLFLATALLLAAQKRLLAGAAMPRWGARAARGA